MRFSSGKCTVPTERIRHSKVFHLLSLLWLRASLVIQWRSRLPMQRPRLDPWVEKIPWRRNWQPTIELLPGKSHGQRSLAGHSPWGQRVGHNLRMETTTTIMIKTSGCVSCASKQCFPWWNLGFPMAVQVWHPHPGSFEAVNRFTGVSNCVLFNWSLSFLLQFTFPWAVGGKKDFKKMLYVNDFFPDCKFVSSVLCIYDYEAICMKFTPFQISKIALLRKNPCSSQYHTD